MKDLYRPENWLEDLFGFRREFDDMINKIVSRRPWPAEFPEFKKTFSMTPAVEAYLDKEGRSMDAA